MFRAMKGFPLPAVTLADRFRGYYPVVVDVETGGFDCEGDALLEIAAVLLEMTPEGRLRRSHTVSTHVVPFPGSNIDPRSLEITGIDPSHPLRAALDEREALDCIFEPVRKAMKAADCTRAILVGHNAAFDLSFLNAAIRRTGHKRSPFHPFSTFDTVSLAGLTIGQTVLGKALHMVGLGWNSKQAHSAIYDAEQTAELFCAIVNRWRELQATTTDASSMAALLTPA